MEIVIQAVGLPFLIGSVSTLAALFLMRRSLSAVKTFLTIIFIGGAIIVSLCYFYDFIPEEMKEAGMNAYHQASGYVSDLVRKYYG